MDNHIDEFDTAFGDVDTYVAVLPLPPPAPPQQQQQQQQQPPPLSLTSNASSSVGCTPPSNITGTRHAILRLTLLNPVVEWRNIPEDYRNDKLFILQFLHKANEYKLPLPCKDDFERKFPYHLRPDRDIVYALSQRYDFGTIYDSRLLYVPEIYTDDKEMMLSYCKTISRSLQDCSYRLQNDVEVVTTAIQNDGMELQYASSEMQNNEIILRQACANNICAMGLCSSEVLRQKLLNDYDFICSMFRTAGGSLLKEAAKMKYDDGCHVYRNQQMEYAKKILRSLKEPLRSNREVLVIAMEQNILSYAELSTQSMKYVNDIEVVIDTISRRASAYLELCQIPSNEQWFKSTTGRSNDPPTGTLAFNECCGGGLGYTSSNETVNDDCHRIAFATITSSTSDAIIIGKVLENIPTFLMSSEYRHDVLVHNAIVDRADLAYMQIHIKEKFPYLCSNVEIMTRAIQRDCNLFVQCTEKDDPVILIAAMLADTAYPLLRTKPIEYVLGRAHDVLLHVIRISKSYDLLSQFIPDHIWMNNMALQKAWIERKGALLRCTEQILSEYTTNELDCRKNVEIRDLALYIAQYNSEMFFNVPLQLRSDVQFMKRALQVSNGNVMKYGCPMTIQHNMECIIYKIAYYCEGCNTPTYENALTDIKSVTPIQIHDHIQYQFHNYDTFVNPFLCTIYQPINVGDALSERKSTLSILNCGIETSTALLKRIASFIGAPIGQSYHVYEKAYRNIYNYTNPVKPSRDTTTIPSRTTTVPVANTNVQPPPPQPGAADMANLPALQNLVEFYRSRREAHIRAAIMPDAVDEEDVINVWDDDPDDDDDFLEEMMMDVEIALMRGVDNVLEDEGQLPRAAGAAVEQEQQHPPEVQPPHDMERFLLENNLHDPVRRPVVGVNIPPRLANPMLLLARFGNVNRQDLLHLAENDVNEHHRLLRAMHRRRIRNNDGQANLPIQEEMRIIRMLRRPPQPPR